MSRKHWYTSSCGRIELCMSLEDAQCASHQGQCDDDVRALSQRSDIREQLDAIRPEVLREELDGYGAWDETELADHEQNLQRLLWLAAGHIADELEPT